MEDRIRQVTIQYDTKIIDALRKMDSVDRKLLILEKGDRFFSLVSIGDIQRAIIKNVDLNSPVYKIVREDIKVANKMDTFEKIKNTMLKYRMEFLPVVEDGKIYDVYFWEDVIGSTKERFVGTIDVPVIVMAGGRGTRLKPITNVIPKPLIPIGDKSMLEIIFDRFGKYGVKNFYLSVNYKYEMIQYYLSQLNLKDINIEYIIEDKPLGTAGSLSLMKDKIPERCFITNCDIIINQDYKELLDYHIENRSVLTVIGVLKSEEIPYGVIEKDGNGNIFKIDEKPVRVYIVNSGMYIIEKKALEYIPKDTLFDMTDLVKVLIDSGEKVSYFPVSENSWFDIGEWDKYQKVLVEYETLRRVFE